MKPNDEFLHDLYDRIHETPMQQKLRRMAPMPIGVVFLPWPGMTDDEAREHFRTMKKLGFNCLKQTMELPERTRGNILNLALDEGVIPYWYAEGGWEEITPALLQKIGLPPDLDVDEAIENPAMIAYQTEVIRARITRQEGASQANVDPQTKDLKEAAKKVPGVVGDMRGWELHPDAVPEFMAWLKDQYGTVEAVTKAWNADHVGISDRAMRWKTWDDVRDGLDTEIPRREYRHLRDIMRFRSDMFIRDYVRRPMERHHAEDPDEPIRAGGEMGLFLPFASRGTDMEGMAREMAIGGSFYPSLHLAWHFEEVDFEYVRPVYMQAQIAADWAKGIWSATWESTGGPQYFSGGKAPFVEEARMKTAGFTTDENTITQLMFTYLAAGFRGVGLWCWNARTAGWEAGEYALLDRNRNVTPRTIRAGQIGLAARRWRRELWQAHKEPLVGVMVDWENEAIWAAMSVTGRDKFKNEPVRARIGISRALINANVPWEYVTPANLRAGLGGRYKVIYLPACLSISHELQQMLLGYVQEGGRLVLDMPGAYFDEYGRVYDTSSGSIFEQTFGAVLNEFHYSNVNTPLTVEGVPLEGFAAMITPASARVVASYEESGRVAITEAKVGAGSAVILGLQASLNCWKSGNAALEQLTVRHTLGSYESPYSCDGAVVYRIAAPRADHYFLINDSAAKSVMLDTKDYAYDDCIDVITGESVLTEFGIDLPGYGGRWLRFEKSV